MTEYVLAIDASSDACSVALSLPDGKVVFFTTDRLLFFHFGGFENLDFRLLQKQLYLKTDRAPRSVLYSEATVC